MSVVFEQAWLLLKNEHGGVPFQNNFGQDPPGMAQQLPMKFSDMQPTPVPPLLQGRQTPSNVVHSSGRLPLTREDIERMMLEGQRGQTPLGEGVPAPQERMITDFNLQQSMKAGGMPSTHALSGPQ